MESGNHNNNEMNEEKFANVDELPNTEAFQDEFTREFLVSTEEVEPGYYLFESGTGGYRMLFPTNAVAGGPGFYEKDDENTFESIGISGRYEEEHIIFSIKVKYEKASYTNRIEDNLEALAGTFDYEGEFQEYQSGDNIIFLGEHIDDLSDIAEGAFYYVFLAYIKSRSTDQAVSITYSSTCRKNAPECNIDRDVEINRAKKIFESIEFID